MLHTNRFVVFQVEDEWLVTYGDRRQIAFTSCEQAERSAFDAADALARSGQAVSVLIMPNGAEADAPHFAILTGHTPHAQFELATMRAPELLDATGVTSGSRPLVRMEKGQDTRDKPQHRRGIKDFHREGSARFSIAPNRKNFIKSLHAVKRLRMCLPVLEPLSGSRSVWDCNPASPSHRALKDGVTRTRANRGSRDVSALIRNKSILSPQRKSLITSGSST